MASSRSEREQYGVLHFKAAQLCIAGRNKEGYAQYARVVAKILRDGVTNSREAIPKAPPHITVRVLFLDALHALASGISHEIIDPREIDGLLATLESVVSATHDTSSEYDAAILANYALARHSWTVGDRSKAAEYNGAAVHAGVAADAAGFKLEPYAVDKYQGARDNLLQLRLPEGSAIKEAHCAAMAATTVGGVAVRAGLVGTMPALPPSLCAACGKDLASSKCSRCSAVRYCGRSCQAAHWPEHKKLCKSSSK